MKQRFESKCLLPKFHAGVIEDGENFLGAISRSRSGKSEREQFAYLEMAFDQGHMTP